MSQTVTLTSSNYTHRVWTDDAGEQHIWCSEAIEWDHYGQPGTGFGWCPHDVDEYGDPLIVEAGP